MKTTKAQREAAKRYRLKRKKDREDLRETLHVLGQMEDFGRHGK